MNPIQQGLQEYLALRQSLGYQLRRVRCELGNFVRFLEAEGAAHITTDLAVRWATQAEGVQPATWSWRLGMARRFAAWLSTLDPQTEVPPPGLLPYCYRRRRPYIYTVEQIERLVQTAAGLPSPRGLRGHTYSTVFGLLAVSGMRVSEALLLDRGDVNLVEGVLFLRRTKFGKSRLIYVHPSTQTALSAYAAARDRVLPHPKSEAFFLLERGTRVTHSMADWTFA
ncbi:tyrosine-type recombinase/integrase, partial [Acidobacteria bacterium AH-259-G07]|nr:tyrosine-type recombinase/integrase [Acidobacteria bacterium AH-259-G07]